VTRSGCAVGDFTWPPKAMKSQASDNSGQTLPGSLLLETVAQRGKTAAHKPLSFSLLLTFPGQTASLVQTVLEKVYPRNQGWTRVSALVFRVEPSCQGWTVITSAQTILLQGQLQRRLHILKPVCQRRFTKTSQDSTIFIKTEVVVFLSTQQRFRDLSCLFFPDRLPKLVFPQLRGLNTS